MNTKALMERIESHQTFNYRGAFPSLRQIASECQVPPSTFTRLKQGKGIDGTNLVSILLWLRLQKGETWNGIMVGLTENPKVRR